MGKTFRALGLMSGTSLDGIDVALVDTDGEEGVNRGPSMTFPYADATKSALRAAIGAARAAKPGAWDASEIREADEIVTREHVSAVRAFLETHALAASGIDVVGFHGQTILHDPGRRLTKQIGDGESLARRIGAPVVHSLRSADVEAGGQGAPLAPFYHRAFAARLGGKPVAVLNLGGVSNVTWIGRDGRLLAFDAGPGNAMIDDWMLRRTGTALDEGGARAAGGVPDRALVHEYLSHPFFAAPPPKSLDRHASSLAPLCDRGVSVEDGAATLAAFAAGGVGRAREHMPSEPETWIVSGGGRKNRTLMAMIAGCVENAVAPAEAIGLDGDSVEAEAWAYLAVRSLRGLPITSPGTTGAPREMTGGILARP